MDDQIFKSEDGAALRFFVNPIKNNFQSEKHGKPLFDTVLYVEVITPGSTESIPQFMVERVYCAEASPTPESDRIVERTDKYEQYKEQVEAFKRQDGSGTMDGTPLNQWAQIDVGTAASMKAQGVFTVEQLATVSDGNLSKLGLGGRVLREQARAFIQTRQFGVPSAAMAAENANLSTEVEALRGKVAILEAQLATAQAAQAGVKDAPAPQPTPKASKAASDPLAGAIAGLGGLQPSTGAAPALI